MRAYIRAIRLALQRLCWATSDFVASLGEIPRQFLYDLSWEKRRAAERQRWVDWAAPKVRDLPPLAQVEKKGDE